MTTAAGRREATFPHGEAAMNNKGGSTGDGHTTSLSTLLLIQMLDGRRSASVIGVCILRMLEAHLGANQYTLDSLVANGSEGSDPEARRIGFCNLRDLIRKF